MQEEEINLRDYINVVLKRKRTIFTILFVSVAVAVIVSFLSPRVYRISMILEPPRVEVTSEGMPIYLDSPENIKTVIESGSLNSKIIKALNLDSTTRIKFRVSQPSGTSILKISIERQEKETEDGIRILNQLVDELSKSYFDRVEFKKNSIENEISAISSDIAVKNSEIKSRGEMLRILEERKNGLIDEIKEIKLTKSKKFDKGEALLVNYLDQLNRQLVDLKIEKENIKIIIMNSQSETEKLQIDIELLNLAKEGIHDMRLIQKPTVSPNPIKPKKKQNVAISSVLGLMLGIFIAFLQEYWEKTGSGNEI